MGIPSPDDIVHFLSMPFIQLFWPAIVGFLLLFAIASKGPRWLALPVLAIAGFYQAVHMGAL